MESLTFELCVAPGDPGDRSLCLLAKSGRELVACRAWRIRRDVRFGTLLLWMERLALAWARPELDDSKAFGELLEEVEEALTEPF